MRGYRLPFIAFVAMIILVDLYTVLGLINILSNDIVSGIIDLVVSVVWGIVLILNIRIFEQQVKQDAYLEKNLYFKRHTK